MKVKPPKIDERDFSDLLNELKASVPHYTPEWTCSDEKDPGVALSKIFIHMTSSIIQHFNQVPHKNFVAFLDMLGIRLLPAQSARVPLTFKTAKGTENEIFIPERTMASADETEEHEEIPFETEKNLLAIPAQLSRAISVDPEKIHNRDGDAIYLSPPGFLDQEQKSKVRLTYKLVTSSPEDDNDFQLDHVTELEKGDFLKIEDGKNTEYVIISDISETIVTLQDKLIHSFNVDSKVTKITRFNLFQGKNQQEHILYIGHKDLFNVKSSAEFILYIKHYKGTWAGVTPLKVSWEYWGEIEGKEGEDWYGFNTIDQTAGLSNNGEIELNKLTEGEIKEKEINSVKSRWIRCLLKEPLPVNVPKKLPDLDTIMFMVRSSSEDILPDLAFNNDTPLDNNQPFTPFGKEPRIFDNFSIASKEVLSKKGGKIILDVKVESRGIIGPPTAIEVDGKIKVFARGTFGRLTEVEIDPSPSRVADPVWTDRGFPPYTTIAQEATPSAILYPASYMRYTESTHDFSGNSVPYSSTFSIFARAENGHLVEGFYNGIQWEWVDYGAPDGGIKFDPATIFHENPGSARTISVFVTGSDGSLYEFNRSPESMAGNWIDHNLEKPDDLFIDSSPYADSYDLTDDYCDGEIRVKVFVKGKNGKLYELDCKAGDNKSDQWINIEDLPDGEEFVDSRPFIYKFKNYNSVDIHYYAKVFIKSSLGKLWEFDTKVKEWKYLGPNSTTIDSASHGYFLNPVDYSNDTLNANEGKHIFVRGTDNCLWERTDSLWIYHNIPANLKLRFTPFAVYPANYKITNNNKYLHIFSVSSHNSLIERRIELVEISGQVLSAGQSTIKLDGEVSSENDLYKGMEIKIISGAGAGQIRTIIQYDGNEKIASVDQNWDLIPNDSSSYLIFGYGSMFWNEYQDPDETALTPTLSWEYWNSKGWMVLKGIKDNTKNLLIDGQIMFNLPEDIEETEITGQESYWIRARIVGGDYGKEIYAIETDISTKDTIRSPIVNSLTISYSFEKELFPEKCLTYNNREYLDQSDVCGIKNKRFSPFIRMQEKKRSVYLGFDRSFKGGPARIYFAAEELPFTGKKKPKVDWFYSTKDNWDELSCLDDTEGLIKADILELIGPEDFSGKSYFGSHCRWIKGSLTKGEYEQSPLLDGIYPNTTLAVQTETIKDEIIGSSSGEANQTFSILKFPVLEKEQIRVCEILTEEEKQSLITTSGKDVIHEEKDEQGKVTETWVLWLSVSYFFDSTDKDRHFILDRATGQIIFGDGKRGMIPQAGENNIKPFSYQWGGGKQGNVQTGEIKTLKSAVAGIDSVINPADADGGADTVSLDQMLEIGPAMISHRNRAVTVSDFEWLAKQGSRKLAKVRCLPNTNNRKTVDNERVRETGWVTVVIVPDSREDKPKPSFELRRKVQKYLEDHCANTLSSKQHVYVTGPFYVDIDVSVDVFITSVDVAYTVESEVKKKLRAFFHPLTGGPEENGWDFGGNVSASDIYVLLGGIDGVDHVERLKFSYNGTTGTTDIDVVEVKKEFLVANGTHTINLELVKGG